jgi:hypothetical protein
LAAAQPAPARWGGAAGAAAFSRRNKKRRQPASLVSKRSNAHV